MTKDEIFNKVKNDDTLIYNQPIFDVFIQVAGLSLDNYLSLSDKQKETVSNFDLISKQAGKNDDFDTVKKIVNKLSDNHVFVLLQFAKNKNEIAKIIIKNKKELSKNVVYWLILESKNLSKEFYGEENLNKLERSEVEELILRINRYDDNDKEKFIRLLGRENLNKLEIDSLMPKISYSNFFDDAKQLVVKLIIQNKDISTEDINPGFIAFINDINNYSLRVGFYKLLISKMKLNNKDIRKLLSWSRSEDKNEIVKLIIQNKKELTHDDIFSVLQFHPYEKKTTISLLGPENINKLEDHEKEKLGLS